MTATSLDLQDRRTPLEPLVLLVDDDYDCLQVSRQVLEGAGYRVACAFDADEAWNALENHKPALVISDLMMKSLDAGFTLARRLKDDARFAGIPVMLLTAVQRQLGFDFRPRDADDLARMHADAFLDKPVAPVVLLGKVRDLLASGARP